MSFYSDAQILEMVNQNLYALDQQQANLFPAHLDPYSGGMDGFIQQQIDFNNNFLSWGWEQAQALAVMWPNDQPIPGFTTNDLIAANMGAQQAFDGYFNTVQQGSNAVGIANGEVASAIGGYWNGFALDGTPVYGISNDYGYAGIDGYGNVYGFDQPIQDPYYTPVVGWSEPTYFW